MPYKQDTPSLLHALKRLQARLMLLVFRRRMSRYHAGYSGVNNQDITTPLSKHIDILSASAQENTQEMHYKENWAIVDTISKTRAKKQKEAEQENTLIGTTLSGLAHYFKANSTQSIMNPYLSEKLKDSTWEHIHTAIRLAYHGEVEKALLHADIANNALKEVAHYMDEEDYLKLTEEINNEISHLH